MPIVEVFADVTCPFTYVGLRGFLTERARRARPDVHVRLRAWPLEVVNGQPLDPHHVAAEVLALRAGVAPELFEGFDVTAFPETSVPALGLAAAAYEVSDTTGEAVSLDVRAALFERGEDIARPEVLHRIAVAHGIVEPDDAGARASVLADLDEGRRRGVVGSPHFFVGDHGAFCPSLSITRDAAGRSSCSPTSTASIRCATPRLAEGVSRFTSTGPSHNVAVTL